jgi:hypothetical protein
MKRILMIAFLILCALPFTVLAQEATEVLPGEVQAPAEGEPTLESVTADPASYYGQEVTFEGVVAELVNIRSFLLGEGAAIDDDQVLVLNNTGQEFNIGLTKDARVRVTGTIYPAFDQGGWDQILTLPTGGAAGGQTGGMTGTTGDQAGGEMATEEAAMDGAASEEMATEEPMAEPTAAPMEGEGGSAGAGMPTGVGLSEYPAILLQERFPSHTLMVVDSLDNITFVEEGAEGG